MNHVLTGTTSGVLMQLVLESAIRATLLGLGVWCVLRLVPVRRAVHAWTMWLGVLAVSALMPLMVIVTAHVPNGTPADTTSLSLLYDIASAATDPGVYGRVTRLVYFGVAGILLLRVVFGMFALARIWRRATPVARLSSVGVRVRCSNAVASPVATGAGILLPTDWSTWSVDARACVLTHEISHLARRDFYWQLMAQLHAAVFWFNPFAWWLRRNIAVLAEHVSDDAAIASTGRPVEYAAMLLQFAGQRQHNQLAVGMARAAGVSQRIERILRGTPSTSVGGVERTVLAVCLVPAVLLGTLSPQLRVSDRAGASSRLTAFTSLPVPLQPSTTTLSPLRGRLAPLAPLW
jgi:beta-lactamase regulating signal transducer with metallopeptidase domain